MRVLVAFGSRLESRDIQLFSKRSFDNYVQEMTRKNNRKNTYMHGAIDEIVY